MIEGFMNRQKMVIFWVTKDWKEKKEKFILGALPRGEIKKVDKDRGDCFVLLEKGRRVVPVREQHGDHCPHEEHEAERNDVKPGFDFFLPHMFAVEIEVEEYAIVLSCRRVVCQSARRNAVAV